MKSKKTVFGIFTLAILLLTACKPAPEAARLEPPKQTPLPLAPRGASLPIPAHTPMAVPREAAPLILPAITPFQVPEAPKQEKAQQPG